MLQEGEAGNPSDDRPINLSKQVGDVSHIVMRPPKRTPTESAIIEMSGSIRIILMERLSGAHSLQEFIRHYYVLSSFNSGSIDWMWQDNEEGPSQNDVVEFFDSEDLKKRVSKDVSAVRELMPKVTAMQDSPDHIKVGLKRIRGRHSYYEYGVLAQFPKGIQASSPILGYTNLDDTRTNPDIIFFHPTAACVQHACDDLYKMNRGDGFYIPYSNREDATRRLQSNDSGFEYQLARTPGGVVKQEAENYILVGLHSGFNNEPFVVPVSRFPGFKKK